MNKKEKSKIPTKEESVKKLLKLGITQEEIDESIKWRKDDYLECASHWSKGLITDLTFDEDKIMALVLEYHKNDYELDEKTNIEISKAIWKDIKKIGFKDGNSLLIHTDALGKIESKHTKKLKGRFNSYILEKSSQDNRIKICGGEVSTLAFDIEQIEDWLKIGVLYPNMSSETVALDSSGKIFNDSSGKLSMRSTIDDPIIPEMELSQLYMLERLKSQNIKK
jgi:hypothetical protein